MQTAIEQPINIVPHNNVLQVFNDLTMIPISRTTKDTKTDFSILNLAASLGANGDIIAKHSKGIVVINQLSTDVNPKSPLISFTSDPTAVKGALKFAATSSIPTNKIIFNDLNFVFSI